MSGVRLTAVVGMEMMPHPPSLILSVWVVAWASTQATAGDKSGNSERTEPQACWAQAAEGLSHSPLPSLHAVQSPLRPFSVAYICMGAALFTEGNPQGLQNPTPPSPAVTSCHGSSIRAGPREPSQSMLGFRLP